MPHLILALRTITLLVLGAATLSAQENTEADTSRATELADQARTFFPTYEGKHRYLLSDVEARNVAAAAHILRAALELAPSNAYALWWLGHAHTLLAENHTNRGDRSAGRAAHSNAIRCFDSAVDADPNGLWGHYARGVAHLRLGDHHAAIVNFTTVLRLTEPSSGEPGEAANLRFKAWQFRAEAHMNALDFETARDDFRAFYAAHGNNQWDLGLSIAESYLRERDFAGAHAEYTKLLETPEYARFDAPHAALGYLAGLLGDLKAADQHLERAAKLEWQETVYPPIWRVLLAPKGAQRETANAELDRLLDDLPPTVSAWDHMLANYVAGRADEGTFLAAAQDEHRRRRDALEPEADLMCEVWFYVGAMRRRNGAPDAQALKAFVSCMNCQRPGASKWEWEFARLALHELAGGGIDEDALRTELGSDVILHSWHRPGSPEPQRSEPSPERLDGQAARAPAMKWRAGDLLLGRRPDGRRVECVVLPTR